MEKKEMLKESSPESSFGDLAKMLSAAWKSTEDKSKYESLAANDKVRYQQDMQIYKDCLAEMEDEESEHEECEEEVVNSPS